MTDKESNTLEQQPLSRTDDDSDGFVDQAWDLDEPTLEGVKSHLLRVAHLMMSGIGNPDAQHVLDWIKRKGAGLVPCSRVLGPICVGFGTSPSVCPVCSSSSWTLERSGYGNNHVRPPSADPSRHPLTTSVPIC